LQLQNLICQSVDFCVQNGLKLTYENLENHKIFLGSLPLAMRGEDKRERGGGKGKGRGRDASGRGWMAGRGGGEGAQGRGGNGEGRD
jgi:hypothetical protein